MKILSRIAFAVIMGQLLAGVAFANGSFSVTPSEPVYGSGELVRVEGTVPLVQAGLDVSIQVHKPEGALWAIAQSSPLQNSTFKAVVARLGSSDATGTYTVTAKYSGSTTTGSFNVTLASVETVTAAGQTFNVMIKSMSAVTGFNFSQSLKSISFTVDGNGNYVYVTLPDALLSGDITLLVNNAAVSGVTYPLNITHTAYRVNYQGPAQIKVIGSQVIPEFPGQITLAMLTIVFTLSLVTIGLRRKRLPVGRPSAA